MKTLYLVPTTFIFLFANTNDIKSQDFYVGLSYSLAKPSGNTDEFIERTSYTGLGLDLRKLIRSDLSIGFFTGWNTFEEKIMGQISNQGGLPVSEEKLMNAFPFLATAHYYFYDDRGFIPFVGLGVGVVYIYQSFKYDISTTESESWHFGLSPEAGFVYLLGSVYAFLGVKYYFAAPASNEIFNESLSQSYFAFNLGIAFVQLGNF